MILKDLVPRTARCYCTPLLCYWNLLDVPLVIYTEVIMWSYYHQPTSLANQHVEVVLKDYPANVDYPPLSQQLFNPCFECLNSYPPKVGIIRYHSTPKGTKILPRHREDIKTCSSARPGFAMELSLFRYT